MKRIKEFIILFLLVFCFKNAFYSQHFNVIKKTDSTLTILFELDKNILNHSINTKDTIDFTKYFYTTSFINQPNLPIFNITIKTDNPFIEFKIEDEEKDSILVTYVKKNTDIKKRNNSSSTDENSGYNFLNKIKVSSIYNFRNFSGQTIQIFPISFDSISKHLKFSSKIIFTLVLSKNFEAADKINTRSPSNLYLNNNIIDFNTLKKEKSISPAFAEMLIIFKDSNENNAKLIANWKNQKGLKTTLVNLNAESDPSGIKNIISEFYTANPNLEYLLILGNHNEIPSFNYGYIEGDNYYSDSYYGQFTNDLYPELYVGRISGFYSDINSILKKSIYYEKENFDGNWMNKAIGIGSNEGLGEGDNGESDWQHLRNIRTKLLNFGFTQVYEFYDGDHSIEDKVGSPNKSEIINSLNEGVSILNYTGHGDVNLMLTSQLTSTDIDKLSNHKKNPFVISVACNNGKYINESNCIAEHFMKTENDSTFNGAIGFCGSSILMDWAPPMLTQDEIINSIVSTDSSNIGLSIGELFYSSQAKMLDKYNSLGNGVMQTWILFGDPSIDLKTDIPKPIDLSFDFIASEKKLIIESNVHNVLLGISQNNNFVLSSLLKLGSNTIYLDSFSDNFLLTFSKPNHITRQDFLKKASIYKYNLTTKTNIYPNPVRSLSPYFTIISSSQLKNIQIVDMYGREIEFEIIYTYQTETHLKIQDQISKGIYFVSFINQDNKKENYKIEIQ